MIWNDLLAAALLMLYYLVGLVAIPAAVKACSKLPDEVVRKMQHVGYSFSIFILLRFFSTWYIAIAAAFLLVLLAYPLLILIEKTRFYK